MNLRGNITYRNSRYLYKEYNNRKYIFQKYSSAIYAQGNRNNTTHFMLAFAIRNYSLECVINIAYC